eukprot:13106693-Ditylum_brightwellii.AAC.1
MAKPAQKESRQNWCFRIPQKRCNSKFQEQLKHQCNGDELVVQDKRISQDLKHFVAPFSNKRRKNHH